MIIRELKDTKKFYIGDIQVGDVYQEKDDGSYYMKTNEYDDLSKVKVVHLGTGLIRGISLTTEIIPFHGALQLSTTLPENEMEE